MKFLKLNSQDGFSMMGAVLLSGIASAITLGTYQVMDKQLDVTKIVRGQQRMDLIEKRIRNVAQSIGAMKMSADRSPNSALGKCFLAFDCQATGLSETTDLYDAIGQAASGKFDLLGKPCQTNCPIEVVTRLAIQCLGGASACAQPTEIQTSYKIRVANQEQFKGRHFNQIEGMANLSTFSCPKDEYIRGISKEGHFICSNAVYSSTSSSCPAGTAAVGTDSQGYLKCQEIVNYCATSLEVATVVDVSGTMQSVLDQVQIDLRKFMDLMRPNQDQGSLVAFSRYATTLQDLTSDFTLTKAALVGLTPSSGSYMGRGLAKGLETLGKSSANKKVIILISDGIVTGYDDPLVVSALAKSQGIRVITIGYTADLDSALMQAAASSPKDFFNANNLGGLDAALTEVGKLVCRAP